MRDHSHLAAENSDVCQHCGQPLRAPAPHYGERRLNRTGLAAAVLLHLLLVAAFLFSPDRTDKKKGSPLDNAVVWVAPAQPKPKARPQEQAPKKKVEAPKAPPRRVEVQRLPDTITLPEEKPVESPPQAEPAREPPQEMDMAAYIEARRRQRGAATPTPAQDDSDDARALRNAMNNVASINARSRDDKNETGGVFSVSNKTFASADLKFRGWNPNFKRRWLTQVTVELGSEPDIETAIVKKMIELIRREKQGDFEWDSHRLGRVVTMSARPRDEEQLKAFLYKEMFPDYRAPR